MRTDAPMRYKTRPQFNVCALITAAPVNCKVRIQKKQKPLAGSRACGVVEVVDGVVRGLQRRGRMEWKERDGRGLRSGFAVQKGISGRSRSQTA